MIEIPLLTSEQKTYLQIRSLNLHVESSLALSCRLALYAIQWSYYHCEDKESTFRTDPINLLSSTLIKKCLEKSVIDTYGIAAEIRSKPKLNLDFKVIIGLSNLRIHRHFRSHEYTEKFSDSEVEEFVKKGMQHTDDPGLHIWLIRSSIIQLMIKNHIPIASPLEFELNTTMISLVVDILNSASRKGNITNLDNMSALFQLFSMVLTGIYSKEFNEKHLEIFSEILV